MDDIQLLIYIVFVVIALLSRILGKKKKQRPAREEDYEEAEQEPQVSFEDLLREFTQKREDAQEEKQVVERPVVVEEAPTSDLPSDEEIEKRFRESVLAAERDEHKMDFKHLDHFKNYEVEEEENELAREVREMLQDPDGMAKAVLVSEIINRKY